MINHEQADIKKTGRNTVESERGLSRNISGRGAVIEDDGVFLPDETSAMGILIKLRKGKQHCGLWEQNVWVPDKEKRTKRRDGAASETTRERFVT